MEDAGGSEDSWDSDDELERQLESHFDVAASPSQVLSATMSFREGSYARFCRPDSTSADTAKALLISASDDNWGALPSPTNLSMQEWFLSDGSGNRTVVPSITATRKDESVTPALSAPKSGDDGRPKSSPAASYAPLTGTTGGPQRSSAKRDGGPSTYRRGASAPRLPRGTAAPPPAWSGSVSPSKRRTEQKSQQHSDEPSRRGWLEQMAERRQRISKRKQVQCDDDVTHRATMVMEYVTQRQQRRLEQMQQRQKMQEGFEWLRAPSGATSTVPRPATAPQPKAAANAGRNHRREVSNNGSDTVTAMDRRRSQQRVSASVSLSTLPRATASQSLWKKGPPSSQSKQRLASSISQECMPTWRPATAAHTVVANRHHRSSSTSSLGPGPSRRRSTGACGYNRPCAHKYVGKYQSCMVQNGRLIPHAS